MILMLQEKSIYSMVIIQKGRSNRVEHNILKYNSKVYFQITTITKTYVDYFTNIISGKRTSTMVCG